MISSNFFMQILRISQSKVLFNCIFGKTCLPLSAVPQRLHDSLSMCAAVSESLSQSLSRCVRPNLRSAKQRRAVTLDDFPRLAATVDGFCHRCVRALKSSLPLEPIFCTIWVNFPRTGNMVKMWHSFSSAVTKRFVFFLQLFSTVLKRF